MIGTCYKTNNITNFAITFFSCIIFLLFVNIANHTLQSIGIAACIGYTIFYFSWFIHVKDKLNYYTVFLTLTLLFYFGQFLLLLIGIPMQSGRSILDGRLSNDSMIKTGIFIINSMTFFHIGVLLSTLKKNTHENTVNNRENAIPDEKELLVLKRAGLIILVVSIIPSISLLIDNIRISMSQGYGAIFLSEDYLSGGLNNVRRFISMFSVPAMLMLMIAYRGNKKLVIIKWLIFIYVGLVFLSGSRMSGVMLLISVMFILFYWYRPLGMKTIIKVLVLAVIVLLLMNTISSIRNSLFLEDDKSQAVIDGLYNSYKQNPLFLAIEESGFSFLSTGTVIAYSPSIIPYQYGMSYINGLWMLVPNLFWKVHPAANINTDIVFSSFLTQYGGIGSSFIAEAYWNFGYYSLLLMIAFGGFVGTITKKITEFSKKGQAVRFFFALYAGKIFLTYVRSDTVSFWRNFVYFGLFPILLAGLTIRFAGKRNNKSNEQFMGH